jgi:hypothetical protein
MTRLIPLKYKLVIVLWAAIATILTGFLSVSIEKRYLNYHPYFFDAVSYSYYNAKLYVRLMQPDKTTLLQEELSNNNRNPLRTIPLITFAPKLLEHPFGHMATSLAALFIFVYVFASSMYRWGWRLTSAIVGSSVVCMLPGLYNPVSGIAAYWLDLTAALFIGAAVVTLLNAQYDGKLRWLVLFVLLSALAAFSRYVSIAYLLFVSIPIYAYHLVIRIRSGEKWGRPVLLSITTVIATSLLIVGPYLFAHVASVREFYSLYGYALGAPLKVSIHATALSLRQFIGPAGIWAVFIILCFFIFSIFNRSIIVKRILFEPIWLAISIPILLILVLKTSAIHTISYAVILILIAFSVLLTKYADVGRPMFRYAGIIVLLVMFSGWLGYLKQEWQKSSNPSKEAVQAKLLQTQLADQLARMGKKLVWNAYFDEISWIPSLDTFYRHKILPLPLGQDYVFSIHETVYRGNYPGMTGVQVNEKLLKNAKEWLDVAVVFDDPDDALKYLPNELSQNASKYISQALKTSPYWHKEGTILTNKYGVLAIYKNNNARPDNYELVLAGKAKLNNNTKPQY